MSKTTSVSTAIAVVALVLGAAALAVNFGIPGPQGQPGAPGATGAQGPAGERGPAGVGLTPTVQKLQIEMGEGEIVQAAIVDQVTGETKLVSEEMGGEESLTGEYHRWQPYVLVVKEGDTVELTVVNPRKHAHSFVLPAFGVDTGRIPGRVEQALERMRVIQDESELRAQASVGWPLNLASSAQVAAQVYAVERVHENPLTGKARR